MAEEVADNPNPEPSPSELEILGEENAPEKEPAKEVTETTDTPALEDIPEETPEKEEEGETSKKEEEKEEKEEEEEKEPEIKDEQLSLRDQNLTKALDKEFPGILKKFPQVRSALYRDKEFTKVFPEPSDAKEAAERSEVLEFFEDNLVTGNAESLIESISQNFEPDVLEKFALNFIPALLKKNNAVYEKVVDPLARNLLYTAYRQGVASNDKNLQLAARHLNLFFYPESKGAAPTNAELGFRETKDPERQAFIQEREQTFKNDLQKNAVSEMRAKIEAKLDKSIKGGIREVIIEKTLKGIGVVLNKDENYQRHRDSLFRKAARMNYAGDWGTRIQSLYTGQATKLLPAVLGVVTKEFLPTGASAQNPKPKPKVNVQGSRETPQGKVTSTVMKKGESPLDFLSRD